MRLPEHNSVPPLQVLGRSDHVAASRARNHLHYTDDEEETEDSRSQKWTRRNPISADDDVDGRVVLGTAIGSEGPSKQRGNATRADGTPHVVQPTVSLLNSAGWMLVKL
jgi:hypothetical protein